jgi:hypothetical protein
VCVYIWLLNVFKRYSNHLHLLPFPTYKSVKSPHLWNHNPIEITIEIAIYHWYFGLWLYNKISMHLINTPCIHIYMYIIYIHIREPGLTTTCLFWIPLEVLALVENGVRTSRRFVTPSSHLSARGWAGQNTLRPGWFCGNEDSDWIGLREDLQETIDFPVKYGSFL